MLTASAKPVPKLPPRREPRTVYNYKSKAGNPSSTRILLETRQVWNASKSQRELRTTDCKVAKAKVPEVFEGCDDGRSMRLASQAEDIP
ncbi:hypothetical protein RB195_010057 [Necator americanus]|uniref:Uncharacterized protein n=1 Tax=Necator americanus TaxID=51031 RepID=A0ABR1CW78_NECAM